jgi:hypothetical protein
MVPFVRKTPSFGNFTCYFSDSAVEINILTEYGTGSASVDLPVPTHTEPMNRFNFDSEFGIFMLSGILPLMNIYTYLLTSNCTLFKVYGTLQGHRLLMFSLVICCGKLPVNPDVD